MRDVFRCVYCGELHDLRFARIRWVDIGRQDNGGRLVKPLAYCPACGDRIDKGQ